MSSLRLPLLAAVCVLIAACTPSGPQTGTVMHGFTADDHITFPTGSSSIVVTKRTEPFDLSMVSAIRTQQTDFCHTLTAERSRELVKDFATATTTVYTIRDPRYAQHFSSFFTIRVVENAPHYLSLAAFKQDLDFCAIAGEYPSMLNNKWLVFMGSECGGVGGDGADECDAVSKMIEEHIQLR